MPDHCLFMLCRYDPLRDGPLRYLGYANELGEAFAAWLFPGGVPLRWAALLEGRRQLQPHKARLPQSKVDGVRLQQRRRPAPGYFQSVLHPVSASLFSCQCSYAIAIGASPHAQQPDRPVSLFPPPVLSCSYAIAIGYVCFDTYDKWGKTEEDARRKLTTRPIPDSVDLER